MTPAAGAVGASGGPLRQQRRLEQRLAPLGVAVAEGSTAHDVLVRALILAGLEPGAAEIVFLSRRSTAVRSNAVLVVQSIKMNHANP